MLDIKYERVNRYYTALERSQLKKTANSRVMFTRQNKLVNKKIAPIAASAFVALVVIGGLSLVPVANAAHTTSFVGKGDVQQIFGWNNKALQDNAGSVQFRVVSEKVTERSWICTSENNENTQVRDRTTTISIQQLLSVVARDNKQQQVTGFSITGHNGPATETSATEGPPLNSCPRGPWTLTTPASDPVLVSSTTTLQVSKDGNTWFNLQ